MDMKKCTVCKQDLEISMFNKNKSKKDGLQPHCRTCSHERFKKYYENNKQKQIAVVAERSRKVIREIRCWIADFLKENPCVDCGNSDIRVLEFDHVRGEKKDGVGALVRNNCSLKTVQEEIAKCEVRCRNCHVIKTYERLGGSWHDEYILVLDD